MKVILAMIVTAMFSRDALAQFGFIEEAVKHIANETKKEAEKAVEAGKDLIQNPGQAISEGAKHVGSEVQKIGRGAEITVAEGGKSIEKTVQMWGKVLEFTAQEGGKTIKEGIESACKNLKIDPEDCAIRLCYTTDGAGQNGKANACDSNNTMPLTPGSGGPTDADLEGAIQWRKSIDGTYKVIPPLLWRVVAICSRNGKDREAVARRRLFH
jgi:hypothetical protein